MLPSDMLVTRTRKGKVMPVFARLDEENIRIASDLIGVFNGSIGRRQGAIKADLEGVETSMGRVDYRFIRGLKTLLLRSCDFEVESTVDPVLARRKVFEEAARAGAVTTEEKRAKVLERSARELDVTVEELEASLWADHEDELILRGFRGVSPEELLKSYNLSLAQTLLFKAASMEVSLSSGYQRVFRKIKRLGLMYLCERRDGRFYVTIEGPLALFKMTEKYGTAMAKLLPDIVSSDSWEVRADIILRGYDRAPRSLTFELDSEYSSLLRTTSRPRGAVYDSSVEERFARSFTLLDTGWTLTREPGPLIAGNLVFIPDFLFRKRDMQVYMEIVGFWTEEYLKKKIQKLQLLEEDNLVVAVDENLACSAFKELEGEIKVIYFKKEVPVKEVLAFLRMREEENLEKEVERLSGEGVELSGDVIAIRELAERYNVGRRAVEEVVRGEEGYVRIGRELISSGKIEEIRRRLARLQDGVKYRTVVSLLEEEGVSGANSVLDYLGYEVRWASLEPEGATVWRKKFEK